MNKTYIVSTFLSALILLILKLNDLKEMNILIALEISFHSIIIISMIYNYLQLFQTKEKRKLSNFTELKTKNRKVFGIAYSIGIEKVFGIKQ